MPTGSEEQFLGWVLDETVLPDARLRQGDLIKFEGTEDVLRRLAIVVTADCDLEQKKHGRVITLVPVVPAPIIIEHYLILDDCEKKKPQIEQYAFKELSLSDDQDNVIKYALLKDSLEKKQDASPALRIAVDFLLHTKANMQLSEYNALMTAMKTGPKKIGSFKDQLRQRGDLMLLPEATPLGIKGHIAWVRQLWQTSASDVALRTSEVASRPGERIARLNSPFRYRLTQLLAQVFSDIGLPDVPNSIDEILGEAYP